MQMVVNEEIKNVFANVSTVGCVNCDHKDEYIIELEREKSDGWIPVEDGLPKKSGNYLVCSKNVVWVANWFANTWWGVEKRCRWTDVEAWMNLPEPFKPKGE